MWFPPFESSERQNVCIASAGNVDVGITFVIRFTSDMAFTLGQIEVRQRFRE
jgi:hypothetical protein